MSSYTVTGLKRWSCQVNDLPAPRDIKNLHIYDFDNTLFKSPLPNPKLWTGPTIGHLQKPECFTNGGWWHDARILAATGKGIEEEERRGWDGWWNEHIVSLVKLTMQQKDALNVLLTGRSESGFASLIKRIVASKGLKFDMICLKPEVGPRNQRFLHTSTYKKELLEDILYTYTDAEEIRVYEDRLNHIQIFRDFFHDFNKALIADGASALRSPIRAEVIEVAELATTLDPLVEITEVQRMIDDHNSSLGQGNSSQYGRQQIKRKIFFTGYLLAPETTQTIMSLVQLPSSVPEHEVRYLANNIMITPRPCSRSIWDKIGGIGRKVTWQITATGVYENKIWAAAVEPVPKTQKHYTESPIPLIVLALRKNARPIDAGKIQNWQPVPPGKDYVFDTVVGEKVLLRVEEENLEDEESLVPTRNLRRKHPQETEVESQGAVSSQPHPHHPHHPHHLPARPIDSYRGDGGPPPLQRFPQNHGSLRGRGGGHRGNRGNSSYRGYRGDRGGGGGSGGGGGGNHRGRGRKTPYGYRSLDDMPADRGFHGRGSGFDGVDDSHDDGSGGVGGVRINYSTGSGPAGLPYNG